MALAQHAYLDPRQMQMPQPTMQLPIYVQAGVFDRQAGAALTGGVPPPPARSTAASSSGYAPLPAPQQALSPQSASPGSLADDLANLMDEEERQRQALVAVPQPQMVAAPPPQRRNVMTTMRDIFDPAAATSPNEHLHRMIQEQTTAVWNSQQELNDMMQNMLRQLSRQTARTMQASAALSAIRTRLQRQNVDPRDPDNQRLVITYYVIKNLLTQLNLPATTNVVQWAR